MGLLLSGADREDQGSGILPGVNVRLASRPGLRWLRVTAEDTNQNVWQFHDPAMNVG